MNRSCLIRGARMPEPDQFTFFRTDASFRSRIVYESVGALDFSAPDLVLLLTPAKTQRGRLIIAADKDNRSPCSFMPSQFNRFGFFSISRSVDLSTISVRELWISMWIGHAHPISRLSQPLCPFIRHRFMRCFNRLHAVCRHGLGTTRCRAH